MGAIAGDFRGLVLLSIGRQLPSSGCVEEAEARVALIGMYALADVYRGAVELEMDCKAIIKELNSDGPCRSPCCGLICLQITRVLFCWKRVQRHGP